MQRIIQINIVGRVVPIEEDAYQVLKNYIASLERQFSREQGKDDIIQDIEARIAELFFIRLNAGAPAIDKADINKVIEPETITLTKTRSPAAMWDDGVLFVERANEFY